MKLIIQQKRRRNEKEEIYTNRLLMIEGDEQLTYNVLILRQGQICIKVNEHKTNKIVWTRIIKRFSLIN